MRLLLSVCFLTLPGSSLLLDISFPKDRKASTTRIIGGEETDPHAYPYQVALNVYMTGATYFCGGTLISPSWVLTAAHCIDGDPLYTLVFLGAHNLSTTESSRIVLNSTIHIPHEEWNESTLQNDIGLIGLPENVTLNEYIGTVNFARGSETYADEIGIILGWGLTETGGNSISSTLRHVNVTVKTNEECSNYYGSLIIDSHICTSGSGIVGSCSGDSGGPLIVDGVQVGIVSFGTSVCTLGYPSVFARINSYSDWLAQYVSGCLNLQYSFFVLAAVCLFQLLVSL